MGWRSRHLIDLSKLTNRLPHKLIAFLIFYYSHCAFAENFPVPKQLEKNVEFWIQVFTHYSKNDVVIHDGAHPEIIYQVLNLENYFPDSTSLSVKWEKVAEMKEYYKSVLYELSSATKPIQIDSLTDDERHVFILWADVENPDKFLAASLNVRAQRGLKEKFAKSIQRSGYYLPEIENIFKSYNLPLELCHLPHVESSFNHKAYSRAGASGLWQFTRRTGRLFLSINSAIDERLDPFISSRAAAQLLCKNYQELGSWPLAITAYNHGLSGMKRAKQSVGSGDFGEIVTQYKSRTFGFASKNFYAEFIATIIVINNHEKFYGSIKINKPMNYTLIELDKYTSLAHASKEYNVAVDSLIFYNPAFRHTIISGSRKIPKGYKLRLPVPKQMAQKQSFAQKINIKQRMKKNETNSIQKETLQKKEYSNTESSEQSVPFEKVLQDTCSSDMNNTQYFTPDIPLESQGILQTR